MKPRYKHYNLTPENLHEFPRINAIEIVLESCGNFYILDDSSNSYEGNIKDGYETLDFINFCPEFFFILFHRDTLHTILRVGPEFEEDFENSDLSYFWDCFPYYCGVDSYTRMDYNEISQLHDTDSDFRKCFNEELKTRFGIDVSKLGDKETSPEEDDLIRKTISSALADTSLECIENFRRKEPFDQEEIYKYLICVEEEVRQFKNRLQSNIGGIPNLETLHNSAVQILRNYYENPSTTEEMRIKSGKEVICEKLLSSLQSTGELIYDWVNIGENQGICKMEAFSDPKKEGKKVYYPREIILITPEKEIFSYIRRTHFLPLPTDHIIVSDGTDRESILYELSPSYPIIEKVSINKLDLSPAMRYLGMTRELGEYILAEENWHLPSLKYIIEILFHNPLFEHLNKFEPAEASKLVLNKWYDKDTYDSGYLNYCDKLWIAYRIVHRHEYKITDWNLWLDMVELLIKANKDIHNPRFVCPPDLRIGHDFASKEFYKVTLRRKKEKRNHYLRTQPIDLRWYMTWIAGDYVKEQVFFDESKLLKLAEEWGVPKIPDDQYDPFIGIRMRFDYYDDELGYPELLCCLDEIYYPNGDAPHYCLLPESEDRENNNEADYSLTEENDPSKAESEFRRLKEKYFNIKIGDESLELVTLDSIRDYLLEAERMRNCLFQLRYYLKRDTLILSARKNGRSVANLELSLATYEILQIYGPGNSRTRYEKQIQSLIENNIEIIKSRQNL